MQALSIHNDTPQTANRSFDRERDGFVIAEGKDIVVLEALHAALTRKARIYAEVVSYGLTVDACHMTAPAPAGHGVINCMRMALQATGIALEAVVDLAR